MTLDEAIAKYKEKGKPYGTCCEECEKEHEQLAKWLEELKAFQEKKWTDIYIKRGYNKAIDDFVKEISESNKRHWRPTKYEHGEVVSETMSYDIGTIRLIAEKLKASRENE